MTAHLGHSFAKVARIERAYSSYLFPFGSLVSPGYDAADHRGFPPFDFLTKY